MMTIGTVDAVEDEKIITRLEMKCGETDNYP